MRYLDGALPPEEARLVAHHLQTCAVCQHAAAMQQRLQTLLQLPQPNDTVPPHLWPAIQRSLQHLAPPSERVQTARRRVWQSLGALTVLLGLAVSLALWWLSATPVVVQALVDSQIRTRLMGIPYHQLPADTGAIKQWFADKIDFPVLVPVLPQERYTFLGARLNYFLDRRVAEIIYALDTQPITFVMFTEHGVRLTALSTVRLGQRTFYVQAHKGYTTVLWRDGEAVCGVVSELQRPALMEVLQVAMAGS